jgi:hypothetical protein
VNAKRSPHIKKTKIRLLLAVNLSVRKKIKNARQSWAAQCRELNFGKDNPGTDEACKVGGEGLPKVPGTDIGSAFGFIGLTI